MLWMLPDGEKENRQPKPSTSSPALLQVCDPHWAPADSTMLKPCRGYANDTGIFTCYKNTLKKTLVSLKTQSLLTNFCCMATCIHMYLTPRKLRKCSKANNEYVLILYGQCFPITQPPVETIYLFIYL